MRKYDLKKGQNWDSEWENATISFADDYGMCLQRDGIAEGQRWDTI